jgi:hypothetical protein
MFDLILVTLLGLAYLLSAALLLHVLVQDRLKAARASRRRRAAERRHGRAAGSPEMTFSTHA